MRVPWAVLLFSSCLLFCGCAGVVNSPGTSTTSSAVKGTPLKGKVNGGRAPVIGAHVYLFAANTTGYGDASVSLLGNFSGTTIDGSGNYYVTTDNNGDFAITGDYTCPASVSQVYIYSIGGNTGGGENASAGLLAPLGTCPASGTLSSSLFVVVNEVSTVAMAFATSGYATDATHVSSSGSPLALTGIANAFATATNLEDLGTGVVLTTTSGGNGIVPQTKINTIANVLASCVDTTGPPSAPCATLFGNAMNGTTAPTETATAAINIAHSQGANIATLYSLQPGVGAPYLPDLTTQPNDFSIAIAYTGGGLYFPRGVAIDASGNVWAANNSHDSVTKLSPLGAAISGSGGFTGGGLNGPHAIALDSSGNVWVSNNSGSSLSEFDSSGAPISGSTGITGGGLTAPTWIAFDTTGNLWVSDTNSVSEFDSTGTAISGASGYTGGGLNNGKGLAVDMSGNVWVTSSDGDAVSEFDSAGTPLSGSSGFTGGGLSAPAGLAIDNSGNVWLANYGNNSVSAFDSTGTAISGASGYTGGGQINDASVAIDGAGNVFATNYGSGNLSELNASGSPVSGSGGLGDSGLTNQPLGIAIDGSGNAWVAASGGQNLTELVGVATPVATPVVANRLAPYGTMVVNKP